MMTHPDSESLAWERVAALEKEVDRLRRLSGHAVDVLRSWATSLRRDTTFSQLQSELREAQSRSKQAGHDFEPGDAAPIFRDGMRGLSLALDETADKLKARLGE